MNHFLIKVLPSFIVPYSHWSVQTTSRNQWFSYAHIHTSDNATVECLREQLKCSYITLSGNNINIMQRTSMSMYCSSHHKESEAAMKKQRWPNRNFLVRLRLCRWQHIRWVRSSYGLYCISQAQIPLAILNNPGRWYSRQDWSSHCSYFGETQSSPNTSSHGKTKQAWYADKVYPVFTVPKSVHKSSHIKSVPWYHRISEQ